MPSGDQIIYGGYFKAGENLKNLMSFGRTKIGLLLIFVLSAFTIFTGSQVTSSWTSLSAKSDFCAEYPESILTELERVIQGQNSFVFEQTFVGNFEGSLENCWYDIEPDPQFRAEYLALNQMILQLSERDNLPKPMHICEIAVSYVNITTQLPTIVVRLPSENYAVETSECFDTFANSVLNKVGNLDH